MPDPGALREAVAPIATLPRGQRGAAITAAAGTLRCSRSTVYRGLKAYRQGKPAIRERRSDVGVPRSLPPHLTRFIKSVRAQWPLLSPEGIWRRALEVFPEAADLRDKIKRAVRTLRNGDEGRALPAWSPARLRALHSLSGLPSEEVSRALGVPLREFRSWLVGNNVPSAALLPGVAACLGVPIAALFEDAESSAEGARL